MAHVDAASPVNTRLIATTITLCETTIAIELRTISTKPESMKGSKSFMRSTHIPKLMRTVTCDTP